MVHGDYVTLLGAPRERYWFRGKRVEKHEVHIRGRRGPDAKDDKWIRILNRVASWTEHGIEYEADQRHSETGVSDLGVPKLKGDIGSRRELDLGGNRKWNRRTYAKAGSRSTGRSSREQATFVNTDWT